MTCSRCTAIPKSDFGRCKIYLNSSVDELLLKSREIIKEDFYLADLNQNYLEFEVDDFQRFIEKLSSDKYFSKNERDDINILPLKEDDILNFHTFSATKPLSIWDSIIKSRDLIYILKNNSLITYFQPIVDIKENSIYGYELLTRGVKEDGSIMPPYEMFQLAKESKLSFNLDRQARETAITNTYKNNIDKKVFINFLPTVIYDPQVCLKTTTELISKYNLNPKNITFEVVESEEIKDTGHLSNILNYYRNRGFKIALDDMGSGYSSLNNLIKLEPDYMKIDIEIIRDIHRSKLKQAIFESLVDISKKAKIKVLAEGVETKEELDYVIANGAEFVQGYYFGKPSKEPLRSLGV